VNWRGRGMECMWGMQQLPRPWDCSPVGKVCMIARCRGLSRYGEDGFTREGHKTSPSRSFNTLLRACDVLTTHPRPKVS